MNSALLQGNDILRIILDYSRLLFQFNLQINLRVIQTEPSPINVHIGKPFNHASEYSRGKFYCEMQTFKPRSFWIFFKLRPIPDIHDVSDVNSAPFFWWLVDFPSRDHLFLLAGIAKLTIISLSAWWSPTGSTRHGGHWLDYCSLPRVITMMENLVEWRLVRETEVLGENPSQSATLATTNPTWLDPGLNPGLRGGKPATNRLSYGAALTIISLVFKMISDFTLAITTKLSAERCIHSLST
jgi:hypothetical protein